MKLTIGMIVKNEEKWLERCLSAIKPILDNVDSELIITDTGSTDRTVEIAEKYANKVLHFEWCNDFSAARNTVFPVAKGEWFMVLDPDDIFESCDGIIDFFNSGEYKKYNAATYISRNLVKTDNGDSYGDLLAPRMVKIHPDTHYENAVHEFLNTFQPPYKNIRDVAIHYGYYYETEEDKLKKARRNIELLLKRFETEKDSTPMLYVQLYEAYRGIEENEKALDYLDKGIALSKKLNSIVLAALYFHKAGYYQTVKQFQNAINVCDEYFGMSKSIRPHQLSTDGEIYAIKAMCLFELERYAEAVEIFKKFFETFRDIENETIATYDRYLYSAYMCSHINIMPLFNNFIDSCIKSDKFNTADSWFGTYPLSKYSFEPQKIYELVQYELTVAEHFEYKNIADYYKKLDGRGKKILLDELFARLENNDRKNRIFTALDNIARNDAKAAKKLLIYKAYYADEDCYRSICAFIDKYGISEDIDIIYLIFKSNYDLSPVLLSKDFDAKKCAYLCCKNIEGFYEAAEKYSADSITDTQAMQNAVRFYDYCISMRLMENEEKTEEEKKQLIGRLFAVKTSFNERIKKHNADIEFTKLAETVKNNIRASAAAGNIETARKMLEDYRKINPNDPEIKILENEI